MAVYKVIQDVEAEDKLLGPLTLKGFVYAGIALVCAYINFRLLFIGSPLKWLFILIFAGPMILFGVLASPLGREQPTEVWLLSRIRFFLKPRQRIWDEEGKNDLVSIAVPKKAELHLTKDLTPNEVKSRLKTLALTLDTRGWAVKNVDVNLNTPQAGSNTITPQSDRLVKGGGVPSQMPVVDVHAADDILDEKHNPTAQKFETMMQKAEVDRKHGLLTRLKDLVDYDEPKAAKSSKNLPKIKNEPAQSPQDLQKKLARARSEFTKNLKTGKKPGAGHKILTEQQVTKTEVKAPSPPALNPIVTADRQTVNMELAQSGSAFSVATLSQLANRQPRIEQTGPNEVTISLH